MIGLILVKPLQSARRLSERARRCVYSIKWICISQSVVQSYCRAEMSPSSSLVGRSFLRISSYDYDSHKPHETHAWRRSAWCDNRRTAGDRKGRGQEGCLVGVMLGVLIYSEAWGLKQNNHSISNHHHWSLIWTLFSSSSPFPYFLSQTQQNVRLLGSYIWSRQGHSWFERQSDRGHWGAQLWAPTTWE